MMIGLYIKKVKDIWFGVAYNGEEIFATSFGSNKQRALKSLLHSIPFNVSFQQLDKASGFAERVIAIFKNIYEGKDAMPNFSLATKHLPNYTKRVLKVVCFIPTGYVTSYGLIAKAMGGGPRAVGNVMAMNPFAPIIPCHRVVCSDFTLGGYGGGLDAKFAFLKRESKGYSSKREISVNGKKLTVFPVELVLNRLEKGSYVEAI